MRGTFTLVVAALAVTCCTRAPVISPALAFSPATSRPRMLAQSRKDTATDLRVSRSNEGSDKGTTQEGGGGGGGGGGNGKESPEDFQRRMAVVRSLQMSFYGKDASKEETMASAQTNYEKRDESSTKWSSNVRDSCHGLPVLEEATGTISKLPLFRAAWYEVPGRSNVYIIRDPIYTNMFERIFYTRCNTGKRSSRSNSENAMTHWVFGHLYTPKKKKGKKNQKPKTASSGNEGSSHKPSPTNKLLAWNETTRHADTTSSITLSKQAAIGTLMYIRDYRRLQDGRLLVLVQAAEKFVVEGVRQSLPYAIADVRILPDVEELGLARSDDEFPLSSSSNSTTAVYSCDENDEDEQLLVNCLRADEGGSAGPARAQAVSESIKFYHHYECDPHQRLDGVPHKSDLGIIDITYGAISRALPYCRFSNTTETLTNITTKSNELLSSQPLSPTTESSPSLEFQLLRRGITKIPPSDRRFSYNTEPTYASATAAATSTNKDSLQDNPVIVESSRPWTTDELEYELWLVLDNFSSSTNKPLSPILLALLPSEDRMPKSWPKGFRLKTMLEEHLRKSNLPSIVASTSVYPNHRRQRRFSYSAAHLLESILPIGEGGGSNTFAPESTKEHTGTFEVDEVQDYRALLLSVPSTRQRLRVVLETFHKWRLYQECDEFA